jgi:hypothetical protein
MHSTAPCLSCLLLRLGWPGRESTQFYNFAICINTLLVLNRYSIQYLARWTYCIFRKNISIWNVWWQSLMFICLTFFSKKLGQSVVDPSLCAIVVQEKNVCYKLTMKCFLLGKVCNVFPTRCFVLFVLFIALITRQPLNRGSWIR